MVATQDAKSENGRYNEKENEKHRKSANRQKKNTVSSALYEFFFRARTHGNGHAPRSSSSESIDASRQRISCVRDSRYNLKHGRHWTNLKILSHYFQPIEHVISTRARPARRHKNIYFYFLSFKSLKVIFIF